MLVTGTSAVVFGLTLLFIIPDLPPVYSGSPFHEPDVPNPNRLLGISILRLYGVIFTAWLGISILQSRKQRDSTMKRAIEIVQPIDRVKEEKGLQQLAWLLIIAAGVGFLWTVMTWISGSAG
jgi:hypothetical protein